MCVAYPGKILSIENNHARVDFTGSVASVNVSMVSVVPGDYVLVHAGMAIQKVETEEAKEWIALFRDLEDAISEAKEEARLPEIDSSAQSLSDKPQMKSGAVKELNHHG